MNLLFEDLRKNKIQIEKHWDIDHLCYRVGSMERYNELKTYFSAFSTLLTESDVNGRPIATYKLHKAILFEDWIINVVELPAPKPSKTVPEGFEHVEVVCDISFAEIEHKYQHLTFDRGGLQKSFNQEFEICLGSRNIKFHHTSLESVVRLEKNHTIFRTLMDSNILADFHSYHPLVAGTYPLGIATSDSDLDILMMTADLKTLEQKLIESFSGKPNFKVTNTVVDNLSTVIVNFSHAEVAFEIFVQNKPSIQQKAYRHFLVEERLLKLGGESFKNKILQQRLLGLKTEPAFAKVLNLMGDAFEQILNLQTQPLQKLNAFFI